MRKQSSKDTGNREGEGVANDIPMTDAPPLTQDRLGSTALPEQGTPGSSATPEHQDTPRKTQTIPSQDAKETEQGKTIGEETVKGEKNTYAATAASGGHSGETVNIPKGPKNITPNRGKTGEPMGTVPRSQLWQARLYNTENWKGKWERVEQGNGEMERMRGRINHTMGPWDQKLPIQCEGSFWIRTSRGRGYSSWRTRDHPGIRVDWDSRLGELVTFDI
ncbi:hypothetical protein BDZ91DRAFT_853269 [Kalaharituber pfeilii]|nr:hypothetical protein BDZ91DRAFT_853269 [Kalaharituber pfeilii]